MSSKCCFVATIREIGRSFASVIASSLVGGRVSLPLGARQWELLAEQMLKNRLCGPRVGGGIHQQPGGEVQEHWQQGSRVALS